MVASAGFVVGQGRHLRTTSSPVARVAQMTPPICVQRIGRAIKGEVITMSASYPHGLPDLYPCPDCSGTGQRSEAMSPSMQRERNREIRRAKAQKRVPAEIDTTCLTCAGKGYSSKPYATRLSMPPDWANDDH